MERRAYRIGFGKFLVEDEQQGTVATVSSRDLPKAKARRFVLRFESRQTTLLMWASGFVGGVALGILFDHYFLKFWN